MRSLPIVAIAVLCFALAAACGDSEPAEGETPVRVVASTGVIAEFAVRVAGPDAEVRALIPPGVDLHSFEPSPGVARDIARADLAFVNGHGLEHSLLDLIEANLPADAVIVEVAARLATIDGDPHLWLAVSHAIAYVEAIRDALADRDPAHADGYRQRAAALREELEALDAEVRSILDGLPPERRRLVVFHDAFGYFAAEYGFEIVASVVPANPNQDPSAASVAAVIAAVERSGVPAVFREPQFSSPILDVVAEETGVQVATLNSTLGGGVETYAQLMRGNAQALRAGLSAR